MEAWMITTLIIGFIIMVIVNIAYFVGKKNLEKQRLGEGGSSYNSSFNSESDEDDKAVYGTDGKRIR